MPKRVNLGDSKKHVDNDKSIQNFNQGQSTVHALHSGVNERDDHLTSIKAEKNKASLDLFRRSPSITQLKSKLSLKGNSLIIFSKDNKLRRIIGIVITSKFFETSILIVIMMSTLLLAFEMPLSDPDSYYNKVIYYFDVSFTSIFGLECMMKIFVFGLIFNGKESYMRVPWNILDLIILTACILSLISAD